MASLRDDYWNSPGAAQLDNLCGTGFWLIESYPSTLYNISALHGSVVLYKRLRLLGAEGLYTKGLYRWEGGTGTFVEAIRVAFVRLGGFVSTSCQAIAIDYMNPNQVTVTLATGATMIAKKVVVATSLPSASYISYNPSLPASPNYMALFKSIIPSDNAAVQIIMTWDKKWYLLEGNTILPDPLTQPTCDVYGPVFDVSPGNSTDGVLRMIIVDVQHSYDCLIQLATSSISMNTEVTNSAKDWFKSMYSLLDIPVASNSIDSFFIQTDIWDWRTRKQFLPGVTYYFPPNGTLIAYGNALRAPVASRIYWGGAERAVNGLHWIEGAIQRGNDVACEVLTDIGLVPNCTVYSNWLQYLALLAQNATSVKDLLTLHTQNLELLNQFVCQIVTQSGYACLSQKQPWRCPISTLENQIQTLIDTAVVQSEEIESLVNSAALLVGKLIGLNFFQTNS
ncbi:unnamed protein product [Rotaria sp. Silwood2]|nr:unnamed protein product [Rotaria sp. Silwood2]CAF2841870.1 unnamed protein product [Rotaria sp. Silwood2]CAF4567422.1 unnamed protein product [Rotaria sp. Silwood2]